MDEAIIQVFLKSSRTSNHFNQSVTVIYLLSYSTNILHVVFLNAISPIQAMFSYPPHSH